MLRYLFLVLVLICFLASTQLSFAEERKESWTDKVIKYLKPPEKPVFKPKLVKWRPLARTIYIGTEKCCAVVVPPAPLKYPIRIKFPSRRLYRTAINVYWGTMTALP